MKVNIYTHQIDYVSYEHMLSTLKGRDKNQKHIIITPDRFSYNIESLVFDILNENSLFDVQLNTLSRFAHGVLKDNNVHGRVLTMQGACAIVQKILLENQDKLLSFSKSCRYKGFCKTLFDTIASFKCCNIAPDDIDTTVGGVALRNKLHDIKLVYAEYEKYLSSEYTDSFNQLTLCCKYINAEFKNTNFYFVGFNDFTNQQYDLISALIKKSNSVNIATTTSNAPNKNIYLNNVYYNTIDICKSIGVVPNIVKIDTKVPQTKEFLSKYAFSYGGSKGASDYISAYEYDTVDDEIKHTLNDITYKIVNEGLHYQDFCILVPDFETYEYKLRQMFAKYGIPCFIDSPKNLSDLSAYKFLTEFAHLPLSFTRERLIALLKNEYMCLNKSQVFEYERYVVANGVYSDKLFDYVNLPVLEQIHTYLPHSKCSVSKHIELLVHALDSVGFENNLQYIMDTYRDSDVVEYKYLAQVNTKLKNILSELTNVLGTYECDYDTFVSLLDSYFETTTVALPPITASVFVGDQINSFVNHKKFVYMLGVNEGSVPSYNLDLGIISDEEIDKMDKKLSPTVAYVNKKRRYRVFTNLFVADEKLIISHINIDSSGDSVYPSAFFESIVGMCDITKIKGSEELDFVYANTDVINEHSVVFNNINKSCAKENLVNILKVVNSADNENINCIVSTLNNVVDDSTIVTNLNYQNVKPIVDTKQIYFNEGKSSISQIQTYYECPYKHFAKYGLHLKELKDDQIDAVDFGNIIHEFLEISVSQVLDCDDITSLANENITKVLANYPEIANNVKNKYAIKALKNECVRMLENIKYQLQCGSYEPKYFEYGFGGKTAININSTYGTIKFGGIIDRVDVFGEYFRIIDYKTGISEFKDFSDIKSGTKMQLIVYVKAYMDSHKGIPGGAFYLPIVNDYAKGKDSYKLKGVILNEMENIFAMDSKLSIPQTSSDVINLKMLKNGTWSKGELLLSESEMNKLCDYVVDMIAKGIDAIVSGNIQPHPYKHGDYTSCDYCPFRAMCNFKEEYGNSYREVEGAKTIKSLD